MKSFVVGVDVGGTNIKLGLVSPQGKVTARSHLPTKTYLSNKTQLIDAIVLAIKELLTQKKVPIKNVLGVGMGLPGLVNPLKGQIVSLTNIPKWENIFITDILKRKLKLPAFIDNDANLIALAEWKFGAGRGAKDLLCITLGTGVGGGLILNNRLYYGHNFAAGEVGHIPINEEGPSCNCGGFGCLERYVGNKYLIERLKKLYQSNTITIEKTFKRACQNDKKARMFFRQTGEHIGNALTGIVNLLNPERIVIGGGVSNNARFLFPAIETTIQKRAMKLPASQVKIFRGQLGDDAGILGAQVLVQHALSA